MITMLVTTPDVLCFDVFIAFLSDCILSKQY